MTVENEVLRRVRLMAMLIEQKRVYVWNTAPRLAAWTKWLTPIVYACAAQASRKDARQVIVSSEDLESVVTAAQASVRHWLEEWLGARAAAISRGARLVISPRRNFCVTRFTFWSARDIENAGGKGDALDRYVAYILVKCRLTDGPGRCRVCGCTDEQPCPDAGTGKPCHWVADDLCSACEAIQVRQARIDSLRSPPPFHRAPR
jgi:hypothetical protein